MKYLLCLLFIAISSYVVALFLSDLPEKFYDFTIAQAITPIIQIFLALGIAFFVNIKLSNSHKKNELFIELLDDYKKTFDQVQKTALKYMDAKNTVHEVKILSLLTEASQKLTVIETLKKDYNLNSSYDVTRMRSDYLEYKKRLTNDPFKQVRNYTEIEKKAVISAYQSIVNQINIGKMSLYK